MEDAAYGRVLFRGGHPDVAQPAGEIATTPRMLAGPVTATYRFPGTSTSTPVGPRRDYLHQRSRDGLLASWSEPVSPAASASPA